MYFKIKVVDSDNSDMFSWIIVKHPKNIFERSLSSSTKSSKNERRKVIGKFVNNYSSEYEGYVLNDSIEMLKFLRLINRESYNHMQGSTVCPFNLKGFATVFKTVLSGKAPENISQEDFFKPFLFEAVVGPYPNKFDYLKDIFSNYNIESEKIEEDYSTLSCMVKFRNVEMMSTTEFIQKIYILSYYLTRKYILMKVNSEQIEKFVSISKNWIDSSPIRNKIVNGLCDNSKKLISVFESKNLETNDLVDEVQKEEKNVFIEKLDDYKGIHNEKHKLILSKIKSFHGSILDIGCSNGKFLEMVEEKYPNISLTGIDIYIKKWTSHKNKKIDLIQTNLLYPKIDKNVLLPDVLTLIEVIEHFEKDDRERLIFLINSFYQPAEVIISTPNIAYNKNIDPKFLKDGIYRHTDHKIEYTLDEFWSEVVIPLEKNYTVDYIPFFNEKVDNIEPISFIVHGISKSPEKRIFPNKMYRNISSIYSPFYMENSSYEITSREIENGLASRQACLNLDNIFYIAPTMSPCEYNEKFPGYLEHPESCFDYFQQRGINTLVEEEKYMGSRGYILAFNNREDALNLGYKKEIIINSRNGFPFFEKSDPRLDQIYLSLKPFIEKDFIILDCEIMPWNIKAEKMIDYDFILPGESEYLFRKYSGQKNIQPVIKYLNVLKNYISSENLEIRAFQILAEGNVNRKRLGFENILLGFSFDNVYHMKRLQNLNNNIFKPVKWNIVLLSNEEHRKQSIERWENFCNAEGGEGFVYKPLNQINFTDSGFLIQPAVKVRGKEYLRMVYGIDYLEEEEYFNIIKQRNVKRKRKLAIREYDLGIKILKSFLNWELTATKRFIGGFIGMENAASGSIDATL